MAKFRWAIVCQRALIDQTNNLSLIQILEEIGFPAPPKNKPVPAGAIVPFQFAVVTYWTRVNKDKPEKHRARLRLLAPSGKQVASAEFEVPLMQYQRSRCLAELAGLAYHGPGVYVVRVDVAAGRRWRRVGDTEFIVHHNVQIPVAIPSKAIRH